MDDESLYQSNQQDHQEHRNTDHQGLMDTPRRERGGNSFYQTFRPTLRTQSSTSPGGQTTNNGNSSNSSPTTNSNAVIDERTAKRRSIFTVSSTFPSTPNKTSKHELQDFVSQVNALTNELQDEIQKTSSNSDPSQNHNHNHNNLNKNSDFNNNNNNNNSSRSQCHDQSQNHCTNNTNLDLNPTSNSKSNNLNANAILTRVQGKIENDTDMDTGHCLKSILSPALSLYCPSTLSPTTMTAYPTPPSSPFIPMSTNNRTSGHSYTQLNSNSNSNSTLTSVEFETENDGHETEGFSSGGSGSLSPFQRIQRHNSLENLHHPKNHRSRSSYKGMHSNKKSKSRRTKQDSKNDDGDTKDDSTAASLLEERKNLLACKATVAFAMGAVRRLSLKCSSLESKHKLKVQESAARLILHTLLLNSWRQCRKQNEKMMRDNQLHLRTVENMCLQLRVIRQMHREEKEKSQSRSLEVSAMNIQVSTLQRNNEKTQTELEKVEHELNNCQVFVDSLRNKNSKLKQTKAELQKAIALVEQEKQEEIKKIGKLEMEQIRNQDKIKEMNLEINDLTRQRSKWQEEARGKESEIISLKSDVAFRDKHLNQIQSSYQDLQRKLQQYEEARQKVRQDEQRMKEQLGRSLEEIQRLSEKLGETTTAVEQQAKLTEDMKKAVEKKNSQIKEIRANLGLYLRDGIERRRRWANAFHYLVFPMDIFRTLFDLPRETLQYAVDLGEINNESCYNKLNF